MRRINGALIGIGKARATLPIESEVARALTGFGIGAVVASARFGLGHEREGKYRHERHNDGEQNQRSTFHFNSFDTTQRQKARTAREQLLRFRGSRLV
jgi:hypothetical protein